MNSAYVSIPAAVIVLLVFVPFFHNFVAACFLIGAGFYAISMIASNNSAASVEARRRFGKKVR
jgi:hypothetical protein